LGRHGADSTVVLPYLAAAPKRPMNCGWPGCITPLTFGTVTELQNHLTDVHVENVLLHWPGPCKWPECRSKVYFNTRPLLATHVYNIHVDPLCCTQPGCRHKNPFGKKADLDRHVKSVHSNIKNYVCTTGFCNGYRPRFARRDKLKSHMRSRHGDFECSQNHCPRGRENGFSSEKLLRSHMSNPRTHGSYECSLGACAYGDASRFLLKYSNRGEILRNHLLEHHAVSYENINSVLRAMIRVKATTVTPEILPKGAKWEDCTECGKGKGRAMPVSNKIKNGDKLTQTFES